MLGAIIGDIVGSRFERQNNKSKKFDFLTYRCHPTDDSIMSLAIAKAILNSKRTKSKRKKPSFLFQMSFCQLTVLQYMQEKITDKTKN